MKTLLVINSSGRVTRSITRSLTARFVEAWQKQHPAGKIIQRDIGLNPPPPVNESWIAAAFTPAADRNSALREQVQLSGALIEEIIAADIIVFGSPIYNFGMPAQLKAYFDQIVRVGRTFDFQPDAEEPYRPLLSSKPVIVMVSAGSGAMHPGGALAHLNFLEPHLQTVLGFIGLTDVTFVRVGDEEAGGDSLKQSVSLAETMLDELAVRSSAQNNPPFTKA